MSLGYHGNMVTCLWWPIRYTVAWHRSFVSLQLCKLENSLTSRSNIRKLMLKRSFSTRWYMTAVTNEQSFRTVLTYHKRGTYFWTWSTSSRSHLTSAVCRKSFQACKWTISLEVCVCVRAYVCMCACAHVCVCVLSYVHVRRYVVICVCITYNIILCITVFSL